MTMNKVAYALSMMLGVAGVLALVAALLALPHPVRHGLHLGIALSTVNGILSFLSLRWSFHKSNTTFFTVWASGLLVRFGVLAGTAFAIFGHPAFDFLSTLLSVVFTTTLFLLLELDFLPKRTAEANPVGARPPEGRPA